MDDGVHFKLDLELTAQLALDYEVEKRVNW
jgi:hypothetical protein